MLPRLAHKLEQRAQTGNLRRLSLPQAPADFFSNDYLGLARHPELARQVQTAYEQVPETNRLGATGSRLLSGNSRYAEELEAYLARLFGAEAALVFNSGYAANLALLSALTQKGDVILYDELVHASLREGYRLSLAVHQPFKHNDPADLAAKLQAARPGPGGEVLVVTEAVYSMDGDNGILAETLDLCEQYGASAVIDEAHSTGVFGPGGTGLACQLGLAARFLARVYTFGKGVGAHGACIVGSRTLIDYLVNFARPFVFSTAPPLHSLVTLRCAFDYLAQHPQLQAQLQTVVSRFVTQMEALPLPPGVQKMLNQSPIQALVVPGNARCKALAAHLIAQGYEVRAILAPTVPAGAERLRVCLHAYNSPAEVDGLVAALASFAWA
ncbi:MAG: 8-amino-7-oxononanoate synthase [Bernardetiaceae bacterium]|nr:8-amino-7-oxononanoate synthase [Bernardetiaceae bacterium]